MESEPDIFDLQTWLASATDPELRKIFEASRYLSSPMPFWLKVWDQYGKPDIGEKA